MEKYRYIGESSINISKGQIIESTVTTWSVKKPNSEERVNVRLIYFDGYGGKSVGKREDKFEKL